VLDSRRWTWSLAAPLLVLAGLFAMHGLGDHSSQHSAVHTAMAMPAHGAMSSMTSMTDPAVSDAPGVARVSAGDTSGTLMQMCVAVLLGGLVAWLLRVGARRRTSWHVPRQVRVPVPVPRSRAPDPPSPTVLSVFRC
jgi:hypothetical protein